MQKHIENTPNYEGQCKCCPVHPWTRDGVEADSYGCLPSFGDMLKWQQETGKIWACHNTIDDPKPCRGFVGLLDEKGIEWDTKNGFITEKHTLEDIFENNSLPNINDLNLDDLKKDPSVIIIKKHPPCMTIASPSSGKSCFVSLVMDYKNQKITENND